MPWLPVAVHSFIHVVPPSVETSTFKVPIVAPFIWYPNTKVGLVKLFKSTQEECKLATLLG